MVTQGIPLYAACCCKCGLVILNPDGIPIFLFTPFTEFPFFCARCVPKEEVRQSAPMSG